MGGVYTAWSGYGLRGFLLRGLVAATCLLAPTILMGATRYISKPSHLDEFLATVGQAVKQILRDAAG